MDEVQRIEALAEILREFDLDAVKVRVGEDEIEVVRRSAAPVAYASPAAPVAAASASEVQASPVASANIKKVTAPVVGVFYRSASPAEDAFVQVGDRVASGETLCILEAMKIFNEIASDYDGIVARIVPENGELVAVGDELFWIEP